MIQFGSLRFQFTDDVFLLLFLLLLLLLPSFLPRDIYINIYTMLSEAWIDIYTIDSMMKRRNDDESGSGGGGGGREKLRICRRCRNMKIKKKRDECRAACKHYLLSVPFLLCNVECSVLLDFILFCISSTIMYRFLKEYYHIDDATLGWNIYVLLYLVTEITTTFYDDDDGSDGSGFGKIRRCDKYFFFWFYSILLLYLLYQDYYTNYIDSKNVELGLILCVAFNVIYVPLCDEYEYATFEQFIYCMLFGTCTTNDDGKS